MKRFLTKSIIFIIPLMLMMLPSLFFYSKRQGDLLRVGYLPKLDTYRKLFKNDLNRPVSYDLFTDLDLKNKKHYKVLTIGDSFSEQTSGGYQNFLADYKSIDVLHFTQLDKGNPVLMLYNIINGDILDSIKVEYIVMESVERLFVTNASTIDCRSEKITLNEYIETLNKINHKKKTKNLSFPQPELLKFPLFNVLYRYNDRAYFSDVYKVKIEKPLFSTQNPYELLFFKADLVNLKINNDLVEVTKLNNELNALDSILRRRGIKLIVLPCPDKFDLYYDYISNKENFIKPNFFELFAELPKKYFYIDSKLLLSKYLENQKDIYFYDDTHWTPNATKLIAREISKIILENESDIN